MEQQLIAEIELQSAQTKKHIVEDKLQLAVTKALLQTCLLKVVGVAVCTISSQLQHPRALRDGLILDVNTPALQTIMSHPTGSSMFSC